MLPEGKLGMTRLQLALMQQRISITILSDITLIPKPTLSQYVHGVRQISRNHLPLLSIALDVPTGHLLGNVTDQEVHDSR
jgi:hypothetical protein